MLPWGTEVEEEEEQGNRNGENGPEWQTPHGVRERLLRLEEEEERHTEGCQ